MDEHLHPTLDALEKNFSPTSIFLYGSRARTDATERSDYELGIIFSKEQYAGHTELQTVVTQDGINVYPFELEAFKAGNLDTPFNKDIYLQEIIRAGETLRGEDIIGSVSRPDITTLDCLLDAEFNLGYALGAIVANRSGATIAANTMFYKSCLFATRALILFKNKTLPLTYDDILLESASLNLGAYATLVTHAFNVRKGDYLHNASLFENITYINQFIIPTLKTALDTSGDTVLVS